jgi:DNA polymerase III delta prime subunit
MPDQPDATRNSSITVGDVCGVGGIAIGDGARVTNITYYQTSSIPLPPDRNRQAMLDKVRLTWIDGLLAHSLDHEARIALGFEQQPDAVQLPLNVQYQELQQAPQTLSPHTSILDVFTQSVGALLLLGAPGAGKTTLLLELCRDLLVQAVNDPHHPIPVVFNLSSWAEQQFPLQQWLVEELNSKYDVPRKIGQAWVDADALLLLLDGLDEVRKDARAACVAAINLYRSAHGLVPLAICSRVEEYTALATQLRLQGAVLVQPLNDAQITDYFARTDASLLPLWQALADDEGVSTLAYAPLLLNVITLAYRGAPHPNLPHIPAQSRLSYVFDTYIGRMLSRRGEDKHYGLKRTLLYLRWLAQNMIKHSHTSFRVRFMEPNWLSLRLLVRYLLFYHVLSNATTGLYMALLAQWFFNVAADSLLTTAGWFVMTMLVWSVGGIVVHKVTRRNALARLQKHSHWLLATRNIVTLLSCQLMSAVAIALVLAFIEVTRLAIIWLRYGVIVNPLYDVLPWILLVLFVTAASSTSLLIRVPSFHFVLWSNKLAPWNYARFLDYCADRILLHKIGGGYIFVHRLLLEHIAGLSDDAIGQLATPSNQRSSR